MPTLHIPPDLNLHYLVDDYTDPWRMPGTILLLHGNAESSAAWYAWVPWLARQYRVVRPDMRGFGASTPMPREFPWTLDVLIDDFCRLMDALEVERFHLVGAKIGGTIARAFAARRPERVRTLTVVGTPPPYRIGAEERVPALTATLENQGVEHWARENMAERRSSTTRWPTQCMQYDEVNVRMPRSTNMPTSAPASASGGNAGLSLPKPPSSSGLMSAGNSGSVAAASTMPATAMAKTPR